MASLLVRVDQGILQGKSSTTYFGQPYYSFEGIPYAQPPVGKLRFREPQPPGNWYGIRDATKPGSKCAQLNLQNFQLEGSEDCLFLNVYTPSLPAEKQQKLPVLFYIHGGRCLFGYGDYYKPDYFLRHDVILVTINYRLNILGYLCLDLPEVPGNAALKDAIFALRWVNRNICHFNGDSKNITIFGESSGGASVSSFLFSKMADGLFSKVIAESGIAVSDLYMTDEDNVAKGKFIAEQCGKTVSDSQELFECLQNMPLEDLITAVYLHENSKTELRSYFLPVVEKKFENIERFFEEYPLKTLRENRFAKVPILTGLNSHEGSLFLHRDSKGNVDFKRDLQFFIPRYLCMKADSKESKNFAKELHKFYFGDKDINNDTIVEYVDLVSDAYFNRDIYTFAELITNIHNKLFFYLFPYTGAMSMRVMKNLGIKGATHSDILQYQFFRKSKANVATEDDKKVVDFLSDAWCNFAKNGVPTWVDQKLEWLPYTKGQRNALIIGPELSIKKYPFGERIELWKRLMGNRRSKL